MSWKIRFLLIALAGFAASELRTEESKLRLTGPPADWKLDPFYTKHVSVHGFPVVGSAKVSDYAVLEAAYLIDKMLAKRPDILAALVKNKVRCAVMAYSERTTDVPEHSDLKDKAYWDRRARGLGPTRIRPAISCAEENLLCYPGDPYVNENILVHEFAHAIHLMGLNSIDKTFDKKLRELYRSAMDQGLWKKTYAATNYAEYWAEGVQSWFDCNRPADNGQHNGINTRQKLEKYDPELAKLIAEVFRNTPWRYQLPRDRKNKGHLAGYDPSKAPRFSWKQSAVAAGSGLNGDGRLKVLFLGDNGHHKPRDRAADILAPLAKAGIDMAYTDDLDDLNDANLSRYDCLIIYANHTSISKSQEAALLKFVEGGKGLVALHCASYCFLNSPKYIALVGGQFKSHETGVFTPKITKGAHPALKGVKEFEAWDETYTHQRLSDDREVLMFRVEDGKREPWTWVRKQGKGRVFYTASGHDERVFRNKEFQHLVAQGIRWAVGKPDFNYVTRPFERQPAELPDYLSSKRGGRIKDMQVPLSVQDSMKHISVPGGFRVELFAAEPDIVRPIAMTWDDRGRTYVAESLDYPNNLQPAGKGNDRIVLCADTDGDGKADTFTVFADKLSIPTSMVAVNGGLIVAQAPHMLFLKDTKGTGKADLRKILFSGFNTGDTHAGPSNLRLGLDNWIYATIGYSGFRGTVGGKFHQFGQGIFRFKADGSALEFLGSSTNNTWGLGISETGEIFYSTANGEHSSYLAIPNRYFEGVRGLLGKGTIRMADHTKIHPLTTIRQVDFHGGFTAAAGHAVYTARRFPSSYWNRIAFVAEPTGHLVHMCLLEKQGSNFITHDRFNLFASTDEWTAPISAEVGPDGAVWVIDWYNYIVQHNPTPLGFKTGRGNAYETNLRDKNHGRIYRIVDRKGGTTRQLDLTKPAQLIAALKSDNMHWRLATQWKLVERGKTDVLPDLAKVVADRRTDAMKENLPAIHALWAMHGLGAFDGNDDWIKLGQYSLQHPSASVRRAALGILPVSPATSEAILNAKLLSDPEPLVRRAALLALSEMPASEEVGAAIDGFLQNPENAKDRWLPLAATCGAAKHDRGFLVAALKAKTNTEAARTTARIVAEHYARGNPSKSVIDVLAQLPKASADMPAIVLEGLAAGWPAKGKAPSLDAPGVESLRKLMTGLDGASQLHLATLASKWGLAKEFQGVLAGLHKRLLVDVTNSKLSEQTRLAAARKVVQMQPDQKTLEKLAAELTIQASPSFSAGILDAVSATNSPALGEVLVARWRQLTPKLQQKSLTILLQRPEWSKSLLTALEKNLIAVGDLSTDQGQLLANHPDEKIAARAKAILARGGALPSPDRQKVLESMLHLTEKTGNVAKGLEVFKKNCAKCHRHGQLGENIGPNLTGFAVHPKAKLLTEIIDPNRSVEGNYREYRVVTTSGRTLNGLLASETKTAIELIDNEAKKHTILREDIDRLISSAKSIMPEGFEKQISEGEFIDLLEFLTARGKYLPLPLEKAATIVSTRGMFYSADSAQERLIFPDWGPKTVQGVPFQLIDPKGERVKNVVLLYGPQGKFPPTMPKSVSIPCNTPAKAIHMLSGVSGWGFPYGKKGTVSMIVRLHYQDGKK
ncbi:MAG TPA: PVC-type heme-binding CxxCH protein, partial [Gemmataceae bacterium]|nr:PVC-type heme-binding CxxCH protein [Gemmataceae bacterium]